ncbi:MAG: PadR family transcriptional regulator [Gemmatimonadetes bacterium]|nr:PadR family transcriptional regulator [Gemmatimonadota bacterium]
MRVERELMRGAGPVAVLQLLDARPMHGYELAEAVTKSTSGVLEMGQSTLYPLLYNLEGKGLIRGRWTEADSGRRRKVYSLTKKGEEHLTKQRAQWRSVVRAMSALGVLAAEEREPV